jgi:hypothetical protein
MRGVPVMARSYMSSHEKQFPISLRKEKYDFFIEMRVKGYEVLTFF